MSMRVVGTFKLVEALKAENFPLPDEVREARLILGVHSAIVIQYDVFVSQENLAKLGRALERLAYWEEGQLGQVEKNADSDGET